MKKESSFEDCHLWMNDVKLELYVKDMFVMVKGTKDTSHSKYKCKVDSSLPMDEWRKARTLELYSYLPQTTLEERNSYTDIRDEVINLNYGFFNYLAYNVYVNDPFVSYEDKLQSAIYNFCNNNMWCKYMFAEKYRTDLSFAVFFKMRLSECIQRELNTLKQPLSRELKMEAANQLGIHYSKLTLDDLNKVDLPPEKINSLKVIFNVNHNLDYEIEGEEIYSSEQADNDILSYHFSDDPVIALLIQQMIEEERPLEMIDLIKISDMTGIPLEKLDSSVEEAKRLLYEYLTSSDM